MGKTPVGEALNVINQTLWPKVRHRSPKSAGHSLCNSNPPDPECGQICCRTPWDLTVSMFRTGRIVSFGKHYQDNCK
jgi:hypothetical protein